METGGHICTRALFRPELRPDRPVGVFLAQWHYSKSAAEQQWTRSYLRRCYLESSDG